MSILSATPMLRHMGVAADGLSASFVPSQAEAHEAAGLDAPGLQCLCDALPYLDTALTWNATATGADAEKAAPVALSLIHI